MVRTLFSCGAGSIPRLKRVTSSCSTPSCIKVRTRDVTSTLAPGTPHSAPTSSPPCARAEPAKSMVQATVVKMLFDHRNDIVVLLSRDDRWEGDGKHLRKNQGPST